jgi:hypothetical protein
MFLRELIKKIRRIEIVTARQAQNQLAGAYQDDNRGTFPSPLVEQSSPSLPPPRRTGAKSDIKCCRAN